VSASDAASNRLDCSGSGDAGSGDADPGGLADTGATSGVLIAGATAALAAGGFAVLAARRRTA